MWILLTIISVILLAIYFRKNRNTVWGGLTIGVILGIIIAIILAIMGKGFNWLIIIKSGIVATLIGFIAELLGKFSDFLKKR